MGAMIYPEREDFSDMPYSESVVYGFLKGLSEKFTIFHAVQWIKRGSRWKSTWKENDFLILHPNLGALVLEVKGGGIRYENGVFHQINLQTGEDHILTSNKKNDPLSQAVDGVYHYRKLINQVLPGMDDRFPVEAAAWFSSAKIGADMQKFPLNYREVSGAVLDYGSFEKGPQAIYDVFKFYSSRSKTKITEKEYRLMVDAIASDFELIRAPGSRQGEMDHAFLKLTQEQMQLLDYISEQDTATIQGVAGTGKTLIAKEAARRFAVEGRRVLFLCFNKFLYRYLAHAFPVENVTYCNIHSLISKHRKGDFVDMSDVKVRVAALQQIDWDAFEYDDIVIDEAQDFENEEIMYFKEYAEYREGHFFVFYDKNQLLMTHNVPEWITNSECRLVLTKNCRNTREIALTAYNIIDVELNQKHKMVNGKRTSISFVKGEPLMRLTYLIRHFTNAQEGYLPEDITILSLTSEKRSILNGITHLGNLVISNERIPSAVFFTTAVKFKGLESKVVIGIDIDETSFSSEAKKRIFYVACSRATQRLALFVNGDEMKIQAIADAIGIGAGNRFSPQGVIVMKTQANILKLERDKECDNCNTRRKL